MTTIPVIDGREIPHEVRLQEILSKLAELAPGASLVLIAPHDPNKLLRKLLIDLPGRLNWGPVEKGPDVWRWQFTGRDAEAARTVSDYLGWDHRRLEELMAAGMAAASAGDWQSASELFAEHRTGLTHHADIEDALLFPAYDGATGNMPNGPTQLMVEEHRGVRNGLADVAAAVKACNMDELTDAHLRLSDLLAEHHAQEEEILFPTMDETIPPEQLSQLIEKLLVA
ncbi:MAG: hemerythrin domain-containing protein [Planctomycetes bacterium]|nr:hemerythrin domain-containing protein [Planctomycetota bacterium]